MNTPIQAIYVFGNYSGGEGSGHPVDPTRPDPVGVPLAIRVNHRDATHLAISVTEQVDFPLTVTLQRPDGTIIYNIGGQAADDVVLKPIPDLILQGSQYQLPQMQIVSSGRCTVVLTAHSERI